MKAMEKDMSNGIFHILLQRTEFINYAYYRILGVEDEVFHPYNLSQ